MKRTVRSISLKSNEANAHLLPSSSRNALRGLGSPAAVRLLNQSEDAPSPETSKDSPVPRNPDLAVFSPFDNASLYERLLSAIVKAPLENEIWGLLTS